MKHVKFLILYSSLFFNFKASSVEHTHSARERNIQRKLFKAIIQQNEPLVKSLIKQGAPVNEATPKLGETPLILAIHFPSAPIIKDLLEAGADVNKQDDSGFTPLMIAVESQQFDLVKLLVEFGHADLNKKDKRGRTALDIARIWPSEKIIHYLEDKNPNHGAY